MHIDVCFRVCGDTLPGEHAYLLYAGLSRLVRDFHAAGKGLRFAPINGDRAEPGLIRLSERSRLRVRLPSENVTVVLPLTGQSIAVGHHTIHLGNPTVFSLVPAPVLSAKIVTFKNADTPERFLNIANQRLQELGIEGKPGIPITQKGPTAGQPRRQIIRVKGVSIVGYTLQVEALNAEESIRLQEAGFGGRTRMGCGFFLPYRPRVL